MPFSRNSLSHPFALRSPCDPIGRLIRATRHDDQHDPSKAALDGDPVARSHLHRVPRVPGKVAGGRRPALGVGQRWDGAGGGGRGCVTSPADVAFGVAHPRETARAGLMERKKQGREACSVQGH